MPTYKDKSNGTWFVKIHYTDSDGQEKYTTKRGFKLKREAEEWEADYRLKHSGNPGMRFAEFVELYKSEHFPRLRIRTAEVKGSMIDNLILPYFKDKKLNEISATDVVRWQNSLLCPADDRAPYSKSYLATVHSVLSAIFNYAIHFYDLKENPAVAAGKIGSLKNAADNIWTTEDYGKFRAQLVQGSESFFACEILYWSGIRVGELEALTPGDIDFSNNSITISKTLVAKTDGTVVVNPPKTAEGHRVVRIPASLSAELKEYIRKNNISSDELIIKKTVSVLRRDINKTAKSAGISRIRIHDIRHSHVSLLIKMGYSPVAIGDRMGHGSSYVTMRYAHMYPGTQKAMAESLNKEMSLF